MKRLIVCNDGTWNTPDQEDNGIPSPTNVVKLRNSVLPSDEDGVQHLVYYHQGVGTGGMVDSIIGGAMGSGVDDQIVSAYHWLASNYEVGDQIFIYGFSRGAFIARSLAGFLGRGLLNVRELKSADSWERVKAAFYDGYRKHGAKSEDDRKWAKPDWKFFHGKDACPVRFLGVWDTVGALGVPDDLELLNFFDSSEHWHFHGTELGDHIATARHAMAIDEVRASFTVTRWSNAETHRDAQELWFPGVHSDVGGGYANTELSDGALLWMMEESEKNGLTLRDGIKGTLKPNPTGTLHNSYRGMFTKLRSRPRAMEAMTKENSGKFHASALIRQKASPISYAPYRPTILLEPEETHAVDIYASSVWTDTGVYLEQGKKYVFNATGEWLDGRDACGWLGTEDSKFTIGDLMRGGGTLIGKIEGFMKKTTGNASTDFLVTKRVEDFRWFSMVGAIANDCGRDCQVASKMPNDGSPDPHQYVSLPNFTKNPFVVQNPGYLYCFPNDVWALYGNNRGSVKLTIRCLQ